MCVWVGRGGFLHTSPTVDLPVIAHGYRWRRNTVQGHCPSHRGSDNRHDSNQTRHWDPNGRTKPPTSPSPPHIRSFTPSTFAFFSLSVVKFDVTVTGKSQAIPLYVSLLLVKWLKYILYNTYRVFSTFMQLYFERRLHSVEKKA